MNDETRYKVILWRENRQVVFEVETLFEPLFYYGGSFMEVNDTEGGRWTAVLMPGDTVRTEIVE
jgi:hypothetical protein